MLSIKELQSAIDKYQSLDFQTISIEEAYELFCQIMIGFYVAPLVLYNEPIFRARKHSEKGKLFENMSDLIYPINPSKYGRLNDVGESIFYGALNKDTAFVEMRLKVNDEVTLLESKRKSSSQLLMMEIGIKEIIIEKGSKPDFNRVHLDRFEQTCDSMEKKDRYHIINDFLITEITKIVSDSETYKYKSTIAIGQHYIKGNPATEGMLYPSITRQKAGCIALKPHSYDKFYAPDKCFKLKVTDIGGNGEITLLCENISHKIENNGKIIW
ncbi:RES domain-containing protein [Flavobacterium sp.]|uniref:RES domain-containing protein n=1 Tax=Flavobacterium sp. TaxID=239 RepID=UPI003750DD8C